MIFFILVPLPQFPDRSTVDSAWSLQEHPDAPTLAAKRFQELRGEGIRARIAQHGGKLIVPVQREMVQ